MKTAALYFGKGVDTLSALHCYKALKKLLPFPIKRYKSHQFDAIDFSSCALFIMPGGRDIYYQKVLQGPRNSLLKLYVENGGNYLGICAGGYYASAQVDFERGEKLEILQERELKFFPGVAVGSALGTGKFEYQGYGGAQSVIVKTKQHSRSIPCFFNGGCYFQKARHFTNTSIIAYYEKTGEAAIVNSTVGKGRAILSGVHFEYDSKLLTTIHLSNQDLEQLKGGHSLALMDECMQKFTW